MKFGKRISMVSMYVALLALTPLVALLSFHTDDGNVIVCKDWVQSCLRGIREYSSL